MAKHKVRVGVIGWIDPNATWPIAAGAENAQVVEQVLGGLPGPNWWVIKSYMGLMATTNAPPPSKTLDFHAYRRTKDFRAMVWANLEFDDAAGTGPVHASYVGSEAQSRIVDPGYTPPVNLSRVGAMAFLVRQLITREQINDNVNGLLDIARDYRDRARQWLGLPVQPRGTPVQIPYAGLGGPHTIANIESRHWYKGEISPISEIHRDKQHNNSVFPPVPPGERLVANGIMRFRAGAHTDKVGIEDAASAYHVPWVWAEFLLTSLGNNKLRLRGASSIFPTVAWYLDDSQVASPHEQVGDSFWPIPFGRVFPQILKIWPVLSAGAPRGKGEPPRSQEIALGQHKKPITSLPWTVPGGHWVDVKFDLTSKKVI